eukprot:CAMPEP_0176122044 /NCGR_PEP_ID=MMETSP0120_2-20121206/61455_1 /TAXON_ID=160619 /ORGANISM="Kryptoperidinium foliaceum, Strain CCMP 1326" /LENGTH=305 /DNA_ID=CAMNT_0017456643 /DNA_START=82 /DNA_END=1000 /DNA_ORIENTATION=+
MKLLPVLSVVLSVLGGSQVTHASSAGAAALQAFKDIDFRFFVAGGTCAAISHGITTPIDVVKTRIQADPKKYDKGMLAASVDIVKAEGPGSLLSGLGPTVVGYGVEGAMKFGVYEVAKPIFAALLKDQKALAFIMASVIAGAVAAILLCPMESLRIRQVTDPKYAKDSLVTGLPRLVREDGFASLFGGILAMLAKQVPYTFGKQVSFDIIAATLYSVFSKISENVNSGPKESRAWTIQKGWTAPKAAGVIHNDFERGFIRAETISYKDLVECGSESAAKSKGLLRSEGKDYVVQEDDVIVFRFNV